MSNSSIQPVGLTRDVGWEIGVRRTMPVRLADAWQWLTSEEGVALWLGESPDLTWAAGMPYQLEDGSVGEVRVFVPDSHLRITWQPPGWERASTIQLRVIASGRRTVVAFHQEHLPDGDAREARRAHFAAVLDEVATIFG